MWYSMNVYVYTYTRDEIRNKFKRRIRINKNSCTILCTVRVQQQHLSVSRSTINDMRDGIQCRVESILNHNTQWIAPHIPHTSYRSIQIDQVISYGIIKYDIAIPFICILQQTSISMHESIILYKICISTFFFFLLSAHVHN